MINIEKVKNEILLNLKKIENQISFMQMKKYIEAILLIEELNEIATEQGLFPLDDRLQELGEVPHRNFLLKLMTARINGLDLDEVIEEIINEFPEGIDAAIYYAYIFGAENLQNIGKEDLHSELFSLIPDNREEDFKQLFSLENGVAENEKKLAAISRFYNTEVYSDDEVMTSYLKATCEEIRTLTDRDIEYIYKKIPEKLMEFLTIAECDVRSKITRVLKGKEVKKLIIKYGEEFDKLASDNGRVRIGELRIYYNLVMDVHDAIFNAYDHGELEGGSDKILNPDVVNRTMKDHMRSLGIE